MRSRKSGPGIKGSSLTCRQAGHQGIKGIGIALCILIFTLTPAFAPCLPAGRIAAPATVEAAAPNFWAEFDITFWQTFPFAAFWGYAAGAQLFPATVNWNGVMAFSAAVSAANAFSRASKVAAR